jgi:hypothetical protein
MQCCMHIIPCSSCSCRFDSSLRHKHKQTHCSTQRTQLSSMVDEFKYNWKWHETVPSESAGLASKVTKEPIHARENKHSLTTVQFNIPSHHSIFTILALIYQFWGQIWRWHATDLSEYVVLTSEITNKPLPARDSKYSLTSVHFNTPSPHSTFAILALKRQFRGHLWRWYETLLSESVGLTSEVTREPLHARDDKIYWVLSN